MLTSSRFQINYPNPTRTDTADVPRDIGSIVTQLEALGMQYGQGTHAARPAAGVQGRIYYETDTQLHYYDNASAWIVVGGPPGPLSVTNAMLAANSVDSSKIADGSIVDADISASAAIQILKLAGFPNDATRALRADGSWAQITNAMIAAAAGIGVSKLAGYPGNSAQYLAGDGTWPAFPGLSVVPASTVAGLGVATDGKAGMIVCGSSPYEIIPVFYSATRGKWVSSTMTFTDVGHTYSINNAAYQRGSRYFFLPWTAQRTAGLTIECCFMGQFQMADWTPNPIEHGIAAITCAPTNLSNGGYVYESNLAFVTEFAVSPQITPVPAGNWTWFKGPWGSPASLPADGVMLVIEGRGKAAGTGYNKQIGDSTILCRWISQ